MFIFKITEYLYLIGTLASNKLELLMYIVMEVNNENK